MRARKKQSGLRERFEICPKPCAGINSLMALGHPRFSVRQMIDGSYSGPHRSHQQGGGGEFVDYREYTAGEDLRRLDWRSWVALGGRMCGCIRMRRTWCVRHAWTSVGRWGFRDLMKNGARPNSSS